MCNVLNKYDHVLLIYIFEMEAVWYLKCYKPFETLKPLEQILVSPFYWRSTPFFSAHNAEAMSFQDKIYFDALVLLSIKFIKHIIFIYLFNMLGLLIYLNSISSYVVSSCTDNQLRNCWNTLISTFCFSLCVDQNFEVWVRVCEPSIF